MKYKPVRFPIEAYDNLQKKKQKMEGVLFQMTGKKIRVPFTKMLTAITENPVEINDNYMVNLFRPKRGRNKYA